jgi:hypothetical protein
MPGAVHGRILLPGRYVLVSSTTSHRFTGFVGKYIEITGKTELDADGALTAVENRNELVEVDGRFVVWGMLSAIVFVVVMIVAMLLFRALACSVCYLACCVAKAPVTAARHLYRRRKTRKQRGNKRASAV